MHAKLQSIAYNYTIIAYNSEETLGLRHRSLHQASFYPFVGCKK
jgi:hypothetical protein